MSSHRTLLTTWLILLGLALPFLSKPVHVDDANFLALAGRAAADPWRPHAAGINWQGTTERAFDVLSNPPGIAWWLAPLVGLDAPVWALHLWMLPWLLVAAWGAVRLGERFAAGPAAGLLICASPIALWAATALTPDLPLLACTLAGMAGLTRAEGRRWPFALLLGCAALFRYSGAASIPVALLAARHRKDALRTALLATIPLTLLSLHDLLAYGQPHVLAMVGFQAEGADRLANLAASVAMLGGAAVLPLLCWGRLVPAALGAVVGAGLGMAFDPSAVPFTAAGGAAIGGASPSRPTDRDGALLVIWAGIGLLFMLGLRFAAARYWLPFFPALVLAGLRVAPRPLVFVAALVTPALAVWLAVDDLRFARAQQALATEVIAAGAPGLFSGHWGWQHHLEAAGWRALEEGQVVPDGVLYAVSAVAWPQEAGAGCLRPVWRRSIEDRWSGPRVHTVQGRANLHANRISARPPVPTFAPWGFGADPLDTVSLWRGCTR